MLALETKEAEKTKEMIDLGTPHFCIFLATKILKPIALQCMGGRDYLSRQFFRSDTFIAE